MTPALSVCVSRYCVYVCVVYVCVPLLCVATVSPVISWCVMFARVSLLSVVCVFRYFVVCVLCVCPVIL